MIAFSELIDLAAERLGGAVIAANDEFFAPKENLLKPASPVWRDGEYTDRGKWMDGWETRRRRTPGFDWCIIRLGLPGIVRGVVVDTSFFRGNHPEHCSIEGCAVEGTPDPEQLQDGKTAWREILARTALTGDSRNELAVHCAERITHLRLNIYPDGGIARLRVHGEAVPDWEYLSLAGGEIDLASVENGAWVVSCSDMFFGHRQNLIMPGRSTHMGDGWETRRRRGPGHDWAVVRLGAPGVIRRVEIDTDHFKGNAPESCSLECCVAGIGAPEELTGTSIRWREMLPRTSIQPHARHRFERELAMAERATHVRLNIFPDGGIARLRLLGLPAVGVGRER